MDLAVIKKNDRNFSIFMDQQPQDELTSLYLVSTRKTKDEEITRAPTMIAAF